MKNIDCLKYNIETLKLSSSIVYKLKQIEVFKIKDLWECKRLYLKENKFSNNDIYQIRVKLQLFGIDLNKKIY